MERKRKWRGEHEEERGKRTVERRKEARGKGEAGVERWRKEEVEREMRLWRGVNERGWNK